jgi:hypothetical protein
VIANIGFGSSSPAEGLEHFLIAMIVPVTVHKRHISAGTVDAVAVPCSNSPPPDTANVAPHFV